MSIKGIAFDLEGTVIDVEKAHHQGHLAAAAEFGLKMSLEEAYVKLPHFIGGPDEKVCEDIIELLGHAGRGILVGDIMGRDKFHYERLLAQMPIKLRPGFLDFYHLMGIQGYMMSIGSLTPENQAMTLIKQSGLGELFGERNIVLREHVANPKPAPDVFLKTASIMGVYPAEQLVFEDSPRGVAAALAAGSKAVGMPVVLKGATVCALVDAGVSRLFYDWREINALALVKNLG